MNASSTRNLTREHQFLESAQIRCQVSPFRNRVSLQMARASRKIDCDEVVCVRPVPRLTKVTLGRLGAWSDGTSWGSEERDNSGFVISDRTVREPQSSAMAPSPWVALEIHDQANGGQDLRAEPGAGQSAEVRRVEAGKHPERADTKLQVDPGIAAVLVA